MKHYSSIYKENYLDDDFKRETFASTWESLRVQQTNQTHNSHKWFNWSGSLYFEVPHKMF